MKENEVDPVPLIPKTQPLLPRHKCEIVPKLQQEVLQVKNERFLQVALRVFILET